MLDVHSHILPGVDDGSRELKESRALLSELSAQGISYAAATPHFYAGGDDPERFLHRRADAARRLRDAWQEGFPQLILGAEVRYFDGMSRVDELRSLCYQDTRLLLVEMPDRPWSSWMVTELLDIGRRQGLLVVLAHIERYMHFQPLKLWDELLECGALMQCNAGFFLRWQTRRKALRMLRDKKIHFLGSDCHNMIHRPPRVGEALSVIGEEGQSLLEANIRQYFPALEG